MREVRFIEPYLHKSSSKSVGKKWKEVADNVNSLPVFKESRRDMRSVRERYQKLLELFKIRMRNEELGSGISPEPLSESEELIEEIVEIIKNKPANDDDSKAVSVIY